MRRLRHALLALALGAMPLAHAQDGDELLLLDVCVNDACGGIGVVLVRDGAIWLEDRAFAATGLAADGLARLHEQGRDFVRIDGLPGGARVSLDRARLRLDLRVAAAQLPMQRIGRAAAPVVAAAAQPWSGYVNYAGSIGTRGERGVFLDAAAGRGNAVLRSTAQWRAGTGWERGLTRFEFDQPDAMRRWTVGDQFAVARDPLGGSLLLGGVGVERAFDEAPYLLTTPQPAYTGVLDTAGTVEIYANGVLVARRDLDAGPFTFESLGITPGRNDVQVIFRDPFGGRRTLSRGSYYGGGSSMLAAGLSDYAVRVGVAREGGSVGGGYAGRAVVQGWIRRGLNDWLTLGARAEGDADLANAGLEAALRLPLGELGLAWSGSRLVGAESGTAAAASWSFGTPRLSLATGVRRFGAGYRTLGDPFSFGGRLRGDAYANLGLALGSRATLQLALGRTRRDGAPTERSVGATGSLRLGSDAQFSLTAEHRTAGGRGDDTVLLQLFWSPGRDSFGLGLGHDASGTAATLAANRSRPADTGWGYDATLQHADAGTSGSGQLEYQGRYGRAAVQAGRFGGDGFGALLLSGALVELGGRVFATPPVEQGFALVRTGLGGVPVLRENLEVGVTDARGDLLVRQMLPFYPVKLEIDSTRVPLDYRVERAQAQVAVGRATGTLVALPLQPLRAATGRFVRAAGNGPAVGHGRWRIDAGSHHWQGVLGQDGRFYFEDAVAGAYRAVVESDGAILQCAVRVPDARAPILQLGDQPCRPQE